MSSNNNLSDASDIQDDDATGLRLPSNNDDTTTNSGITSDSVTPSNTQTQHVTTTPAGASATTPDISNPTNNINNPVAPMPAAPRSRWSQTVGTTIFSYDPNTRRLVPIGGTVPVTTWAPAGPAAMPSPFSADGPNSGAGSGGEGSTNPFAGMGFPGEGHMSTHLSFSTPDGRPIPIAVMRQLLAGLAAAAQDPQGTQGEDPQGAQESVDDFLARNSVPTGGEASHTNNQAPSSPLPGRPRNRGRLTNDSQLEQANDEQNRYEQIAAAFARGAGLTTGEFLGVEMEDEMSPVQLANLERTRRRQRRELERQARGRASSVPPPATPGAGPSEPGGATPLSTFGTFGRFLGPLAGFPVQAPPLQQGGGLTPNANPNQDQSAAENNARAPLPPPPPLAWGLPFFGVGPPPTLGTGIGLGGFGIPLGMGLGIPGLDMERPPDTRRAKELLRGLNIVPRGLVRRMERVEKMLGEEGAESGRLVCAVCYDPLLGPPEPAPSSTQLEKESESMLKKEKEDVKMDIDGGDTENKPAASEEPKPEQDDPEPKYSNQTQDAAASKANKKTAPKPKHPSLDPKALIALPCTHVFHAVDCLLPWFEQGKTTCPTCRFDIDPRSETLNLGRWLGGARRRAMAAANAQRAGQDNSQSREGPTENTAAAEAPADGVAARVADGTATTANADTDADTPMDAEEEDDETDAFTGEDEGLPADLDPGMIFREAIGRAVASALNHALMNQTPPQVSDDNPPGNARTASARNGNETPDVTMSDAGGSNSTGDFNSNPVPVAPIPSLPPLGSGYSFTENIELPGANRDQFGRMVRDDGESSIAATANSTPQNVTADLELSPAMERGHSNPQRVTRAQAPSPSPHVSPPPSGNAPGGFRSLFAPFERLWPRSTALQEDEPIAGPSSSAQVAPSSRPETPRHHPYAHHSRPSTNPRPSPSATPAPPTSDTAQNSPPSWNPTGDNPLSGAPTTAPTFPFNHDHPGGRVSITRHSITLNLALPLSGIFGPPPPPGGAANGADAAQQPVDPGANRIPEFLNNVFSRSGLFGASPGTTNRTERPNRPRRKWVAPEGTSLRSVIESKERQVGLRCDDVSCLWGPEDGDDENVDVKIHPDRTYLRKAASDSDASCAHRYHPECLLVASRVAEAGLDREIDAADRSEWLEVGCPFCRVHGGQEKREWKMHRELADVV